MMLDSTRTELRYALRTVRSHGRFSLLVILILAIGIGASTAVYSAARSVVLAPLPFEESERIARVLLRVESDGQVRTTAVTPAFFHGIRERSRLVEHATAQMYLNLSLSGESNAQNIAGIGVSDDWMETLGVEPLLGRDFTAEEEAAGEGAGVVLVGWSLWQERFAGREDVLGTVMVINGQPHVVVGVMPKSFRYPYQAEIWTPRRFDPDPIGHGYLNVAVRVKPGVSIAALDDDLSRVGAELASELHGRSDLTLTARPFAEEFRRDPSHSIAVLLAAVGFVLLLACANVANLILVRSGARTREFAIRTALGASRVRQIRQLLIESLILAAAGGVLGVAFAYITVSRLALLIPDRLSEVIATVTVDATSLAFAVGASTFTALLFGLMPAIRLTDARPVEAMKSGGRFGSVAGGSTMRWLVVTEVALAFVLMTGAGIMGQDFMRLSSSELGYDPTNVMSVGLGLPQPLYDDPAQRVRAVEQIVDAIEGIPGVEAAGVTTLHPIPHTTSNTGARLMKRGDAVTDSLPVVNMRNVTESYLETLGLRAIRGELPAGDRRETAGVAVISQTAADRYWPGQDPVGQQVRFGLPTEDDDAWTTIVGVVPDIAEPYEEIIGTVYRPYAQGTWDQPAGVWGTTGVTLLVRTGGGGGSLLSDIRHAVGSIDRDISIFDVGLLEDILADPLQGNWFGATLFAGFAAFGLLLSLLGTYGVLALSVSSRMPEWGLRIALGLQPRGLMRLIVRHGLALVSMGLVVGFGVTLPLSRLLSPAVSEIDAHDPGTLAVVAAALMFAGLAATLIPARRAMKIDPIDALREE